MQVKYTRLAGGSMGVANRASLWLASDHVLLVLETMTGEVYRRFFLRDIQAVTIRATTRRLRWNIVLLVLTALNLLPLLALLSPLASTRVMAAWSIGSLVWAGMAVINTLRGPTCETRIRTAVQDELIPSLGRHRTSRRVVDELRPLILAAQEPVSAAGGGGGA